MNSEEASKQTREVAEKLYSYLDEMVEEKDRGKRHELRYKVHNCIMKQLEIIKNVGK